MSKLPRLAAWGRIRLAGLMMLAAPLMLLALLLAIGYDVARVDFQ